MVGGFWVDPDGLTRQYGTQKAIPELGGDLLVYGENREIETYISLAGYTTGNGNIQVPGIPLSTVFPASSSSNSPIVTIGGVTATPGAVGIQSLTTMFPLQLTAPVTGALNGTGLIILNPQIWIDQIELVCLVTANNGLGNATGLSGIGLVYATNQGTNAANSNGFVQVAPNAGVQLMGAIPNAAMTAGATWTFRANANNSATTGGAGWVQYSTAATTNVPTPPAWLGNVPAVTSFLNQPINTGALPTQAWISALASGGTYSGGSAAGLLKLRVKYFIYGSINA